MATLGIKFWGTRGLISSPRLDTAVFGGNTTCLQILHGEHLILVDSGFGISNLGEALVDQILVEKKALHIHIFYTHFHWDHIQGLPFFKPIYFESTTLHLYSPAPKAETLKSLNILFDGSYSPFESLLKMPARVHIHELKDTAKNPLKIDDLSINFQAVDHGDTEIPAQAGDTPHATYAYRFTAASKESVSFVTDHEGRPGPRNDAVVAFAKDSDILIHDGQLLPEEYPAKVGWGHSTTQQALDNAWACSAQRLLLTHHDPSRSDMELLREHRTLTQDDQCPHNHKINFEFAREGVVYSVAARGAKSHKAS